MAGDAVKKLNEKLATLLPFAGRYPDAQRLEVAPAKAGKDAIFVVTHVDVLPPEKDNAANALEQLADGGRRQTGNLQLAAGTTGEPLHRGGILGQPEPFGRAGNSRRKPAIRMKLGPMAGALYDEQLYKAMP